jgi:predicted metal-dependent hydrolase
MAYRSVFVPEIGEVLLSKRKGAKYIRLSVTAAGKVRVGMPQWTPYAAGISFAKKRADWINQQLALRPKVSLAEGGKIGKAHTLRFYPARGSSKVSTRISQTELAVYTDLPHNNELVQGKVSAASEKALLKEAAALLPQRLQILAARHGFTYREIKVRKLTSRWGSCSSTKVISLSYFLIQLPWPLIDYVLMHELVHTKHLNHSRSFWEDLIKAMPSARELQKQVRIYNPRVEVS